MGVAPPAAIAIRVEITESGPNEPCWPSIMMNSTPVPASRSAARGEPSPNAHPKAGEPLNMDAFAVLRMFKSVRLSFPRWLGERSVPLIHSRFALRLAGQLLPDHRASKQT